MFLILQLAIAWFEINRIWSPVSMSSLRSLKVCLILV